MEMLGSSIHAMIETRRFVMARRKRGGEIVGMEQPVLMIHCDEAAVHEIEQTFVTHGIAYQSSGRRNLDGAALTSWLFRSEQPVLMIHCDEAAVHEIEQTFVTHGIAYQSSGRRNLDGAALTSWLV